MLKNKKSDAASSSIAKPELFHAPALFSVLLNAQMLRVLLRDGAWNICAAEWDVFLRKASQKHSFAFSKVLIEAHPQQFDAEFVKKLLKRIGSNRLFQDIGVCSALTEYLLFEYCPRHRDKWEIDLKFYGN